jgi:hypothetical protein
VLVAPAAIVKAAVATSPLPIVVALNPKTKHVVEPLPVKHCILLPDAEAAEPIVIATLFMSTGYPIVHCRPAG